ncbi:predicted protein [Pyrenophora tritici-repentis Pt-1C-BFP]|uniref:Uncharacterized protein n=1 Tax=Pyrenophora tritici-repentis (strain Pt-1C-BFP) TaxID=426418 RepID=B2WC13_PYRTR|nr:uncharacterized protein PTRG_07522 [Pyrenophora tritici-repentis Pt-1C-BFP]EDU50441.1 predicted protein [Pyrenophora tritici-repentis Pt-1C-BFP]
MPCSHSFADPRSSSSAKWSLQSSDDFSPRCRYPPVSRMQQAHKDGADKATGMTDNGVGSAFPTSQPPRSFVRYGSSTEVVKSTLTSPLTQAGSGSVEHGTCIPIKGCPQQTPGTKKKPRLWLPDQVEPMLFRLAFCSLHVARKNTNTPANPTFNQACSGQSNSSRAYSP